MWPFSRLHRAEHASCFRAGSKEETRETVQEAQVEVLLVWLHGCVAVATARQPRRQKSIG